MTTKIKTAVVGYGYWGPNLARHIAQNTRFALTGVADLNEERLVKAAEQHPDVFTTTNFEELIHRRDVEAVAIATPAFTHYTLAKSALEAGKHVLVEKPLAETAAQAAELYELAERKGLILSIDHTFLFAPAVQKIKEMNLAGEIGRLYYFDSKRINPGLLRSDVNVLWDLAVHDLSILLWAYEEWPEAVSAVGASHIPGTPESTAYLSLFYPSGALANIHVSWVSPVKIQQVIMTGSRRMVVYDDMETSDKLKIYDRGIDLVSVADEDKYQNLLNHRNSDMYSPGLPNVEALAIELDHFADCVRDKKVPISDGRFGYTLVKILELATQSMHQQGRRLPLNLRSNDSENGLKRTG